MMRRDVRILLVGDEGVGKSTLIASLIKETFIPNVQHLIPEVTIPPEVTPDNVTMHIMDSSALQEDKEQLETEIRKAHVICIVYAIDNPTTFHGISKYWLPLIRSLGVKVPAILVGNRIDLRGNDVSNESLEDEVIPIMNEYKEVETCVECSAKQLLNVSEVFYFAQKAVLHPTAPLYDSREHILKPQCIEALRRIFKLCDTDKDNILSDNELNEFQRKCFNAPLQPQELEGVKEVVREHDPAGVHETGLTEDGFIFLHSLFIQRGRLETTWTVLRKFGYGDDLSLRDDFLLPPYDVPMDYTVELSTSGYTFFENLFYKFAEAEDHALNRKNLDALFSTSPGNPWATTGFPHTIVTNDTGSVTLKGWLAQWSMTTLLDYKTTLKYLGYLGYEGDTRKALTKTKRIKTDSKKSHRNVFSCYVFGAPGTGKTSLLKAFINKPFSEKHQVTTETYQVVNQVSMEGSRRKYLVIQEPDASQVEDVLSSKKRMEQCDIICFVYSADDPNSLKYIDSLVENYNINTKIPIISVETKCDTKTDQKYQPPKQISVKDEQDVYLYEFLAKVAADPSLATSDGKNGSDKTWIPNIYIKGSLIGLVILASGWAGYKLLKNHTSFLQHFIAKKD